MNAVIQSSNSTPYLRAIAASKRAHWELDRDVLRGRALELEHKYLPDGLSLAHTVEFLSPSEQRFMSQVQGRTYANIFGLVERFINAKVLELSQYHALSRDLVPPGGRPRVSAHPGRARTFALNHPAPG